MPTWPLASADPTGTMKPNLSAFWQNPWVIPCSYGQHFLSDEDFELCHAIKAVLDEREKPS